MSKHHWKDSLYRMCLQQDEVNLERWQQKEIHEPGIYKIMKVPYLPSSITPVGK